MSTISASTTNTTAYKVTGDTTGTLVFQTGAGPTTAMYVDGSQNVGIGTSSPANKLDVQGVASALYSFEAKGQVQVNSANKIALSLESASTGRVAVFGADGSTYGTLVFSRATSLGGTTESMRIDSSGNLLVGATSQSASEKMGVYQSGNNTTLYVNPTSASFNATALYVNSTRAANAVFDLIGAYANFVGQFRVSGTGVIYAQNTVVQSISDQRLKDNIRDSSDGLNIITALRPVRYDWKKGYGNDQKNQLGFIAQEVESVFPEAVSEWQVNKNDETVYKTVGSGSFIPLLVKAIQEQQAIITQLQTDIAALKAKVGA